MSFIIVLINLILISRLQSVIDNLISGLINCISKRLATNLNVAMHPLTSSRDRDDLHPLTSLRDSFKYNSATEFSFIAIIMEYHQTLELTVVDTCIETVRKKYYYRIIQNRELIFYSSIKVFMQWEVVF